MTRQENVRLARLDKIADKREWDQPKMFNFKVVT